ncbi:MAG: sigma-70 family RNA polymerase sigma factor [Bacteroidota bacterium]
MTDKELVAMLRMKASKEKAFTLLVKKYQQQIYYQIRRIVLQHEDANDILQNVFLKAWTGIDLFREEAQLSTWLYKIAYNETMTSLRKQKKVYSFSFLLNDNEESSNQTFENQLKADPYFDGDDAAIKFQKAIQLLPDKQRIVFTMKYYEELKYEEMSQILNTSVGALKASFHHAVKKIEEYLKKD